MKDNLDIYCFVTYDFMNKEVNVHIQAERAKNCLLAGVLSVTDEKSRSRSRIR